MGNVGGCYSFDNSMASHASENQMLSSPGLERDLDTGSRSIGHWDLSQGGSIPEQTQQAERTL